MQNARGCEKDAEWKLASRHFSLSLIIAPQLLADASIQQLTLQLPPSVSHMYQTSTWMYAHAHTHVHTDTRWTHHVTAETMHAHSHPKVIASKHVLHAVNTLSQKSLGCLMRGPIRGAYALLPTLSWKALISINILVWGGSEGVCGRQLQGESGRWIIRSYAAMSN